MNRTGGAMNWTDETLRQFGKSIGIEGLGFNTRNVCCLSLKESGELYIEKKDDLVFVYLARRLPRISEKALEKALSLTHFRNPWPLPVSSGLRDDDHLIFITWIATEDFSLPVLDEAIRLVMSLHQQVQNQES